MRCEKFIIVVMSILLIGFVSAQTEISSCQGLQNIKNDLTADYLLIQDIDCSGFNFEPLGNWSIESFSGKFDGNFKTINNLNINSSKELRVGLFSVTTGSSQVKNVVLKNSNIVGRGSVGGLVGENNGLIINSSFSGNSKGLSGAAGGLVGENNGIVNASYSKGEVKGSFYVGGLIGANGQGGEVFNSYSLSNVSAENYLLNSFSGGLIGANSKYNTLYNSYSAGYVEGENKGGLVGKNYCEWAINCVGSYWDIESSDVFNSACGEGKTTSQMEQESTFENWNFEDVWSIDNSYPCLQWQDSCGDKQPIIGKLDKYGKVDSSFKVKKFIN